jgi:PAS domain-containing protein
MTKQEELRWLTEEIARTATIQLPEDSETVLPEKTQQILHELTVHQVELEMQNEELRQMQLELEAARARYFNLYDLTPVGYLTITGQGLIVQANLATATLLGVSLQVHPQRGSGPLVPVAEASH